MTILAIRGFRSKAVGQLQTDLAGDDLAHTEHGTKRHYTDRDCEALDEPLEKLGEMVGIE